MSVCSGVRLPSKILVSPSKHVTLGKSFYLCLGSFIPGMWVVTVPPSLGSCEFKRVNVHQVFKTLYGLQDIMPEFDILLLLMVTVIMITP